MTTTNDRGFIPADPALSWARFERYRARQQDLSDNHGDICGMSDITRRLQAKLADEDRLTAEMGLFASAMDDA